MSNHGLQPTARRTILGRALRLKPGRWPGSELRMMMRNLVIATVLLGVLQSIVAATDQRPKPAPRADVERALGGDLPRPGSLADILSCAGANEVLWTSAMKEDPRGPRAHEAKRKAGWYSAVALWVFLADSTAVVDAVRSASERERQMVLSLARRCRNAPDNWRE